MYRDEQRLAVLTDAVYDEALRHERRRPERLSHGVDSFCETNASRRPDFIKSESEPTLDADPGSNLGAG